jgi:hypothetical protein
MSGVKKSSSAVGPIGMDISSVSIGPHSSYYGRLISCIRDRRSLCSARTATSLLVIYICC